jgi:peptidoglycan/LPS O-acetylase OafA/YrhL
MRSETNHSRPISAVRGLAIFGVIQYHFFALSHVYETFGLPKLLVDALAAGGAGVDLFFVLSAFLLTRALLRDREEPGVIPAFYLRRAARILPAYLVLLASGAALRPLLADGSRWPSWLFDGAHPLGVYLSLTQNWLTGWQGEWRAHYFAPTWSLAVEEHFYLVIPLVVVALSRRRLLVVAVAAIALGAPLRLLIGVEVNMIAEYCWTICRIDAFGWGVALALLEAERPDLVQRIPARALAVSAIGAFALLCGALHESAANDARRLAIYLALVDLLAALLVLAALALRPEDEAPRLRLFEWLGERCFSLYLFHNAVQGLTRIAVAHIFPFGGLMTFVVCTGAQLLVLACVAELSYRFIERPFIDRARSLARPEVVARWTARLRPA